MAKKMFRNYAECEAAYAAANTNETHLAIALNAVVNAKIDRILRKGRYTARLVRATSASGGFVVVTYHPEAGENHSAVHLADDWAGDMRRRAELLGTGDAEYRQLAELAAAVMAARNDLVAAEERERQRRRAERLVAAG